MIEITDEPRFRKWAADTLKQYPSEETFQRWEALNWVTPAEEGWALTVRGRAILTESGTSGATPK